MAKKQLDDFINEKDTFDKPSQAIIESFEFRRKEIDQITSMKRTEGWKVLNKKIREELHEQIFNLVKNDPKVMTLIALLKVSDDKTMLKILNEEIDAALPDE